MMNQMASNNNISTIEPGKSLLKKRPAATSGQAKMAPIFKPSVFTIFNKLAMEAKASSSRSQANNPTSTSQHAKTSKPLVRSCIIDGYLFQTSPYEFPDDGYDDIDPLAELEVDSMTDDARNELGPSPPKKKRTTSAYPFPVDNHKTIGLKGGIPTLERSKASVHREQSQDDKKAKIATYSGPRPLASKTQTCKLDENKDVYALCSNCEKELHEIYLCKWLKRMPFCSLICEYDYLHFKNNLLQRHITQQKNLKISPATQSEAVPINGTRKEQSYTVALVHVDETKQARKGIGTHAKSANQRDTFQILDLAAEIPIHTEVSPSNEGSIPPGDPLKWNVQDVYWFVYRFPNIDPATSRETAESFRHHLIDGQALMLLDVNILINHMGVKLGPAVKICAKVDALKTKAHLRA